MKGVIVMSVVRDVVVYERGDGDECCEGVWWYEPPLTLRPMQMELCMCVHVCL